MIVLSLSAINLGVHFQHRQDAERSALRLEETALQGLETLARGGQTSDAIARFSGRLKRELFPQFKKHSPHINVPVSTPFPGSDLWVFRYDPHRPNDPPTIDAAPSGTPFSRRSVALTFDLLAASHLAGNLLPESAQRARSLSEFLFGPNVPLEALALSCHGRPTRILHQNRPYWLYWQLFPPPSSAPAQSTSSINRRDPASPRPLPASAPSLVEAPKKNSHPLGGFFLLVPATAEVDRIALREACFRADQTTKGRHGFLRIFPTRVGDILSPRAFSDPSLRRWLASWRRNIRLSTLEKQAPPWNFAIGGKTVFMRLIPDASHIGIALYPRPNPPDMPPLAFAVNGFLIGGILLIIIRTGLLGGNFSLMLERRFFVLYLLAAALPMVMLFIAAHLHLRGLEATLLEELRQKLRSALSSFDRSVDQTNQLYIQRFQRMRSDNTLKRLLAKHGLHSPEIMPTALHLLCDGTPKLPIAMLAFFTPEGEELATFGAHLIPRTMSGYLHFHRVALVSTLRYRQRAHQKVVEAEIEEGFSDEDRALKNAYEWSYNLPIHWPFQIVRDYPVNTQFDRDTLTRFHDFLRIDGQEKVAVCGTWRNRDLDRIVTAKAMKRWKQEIPEAKFMVYRITGDRLIPLFRRRNQQFIGEAIAKAAFRSGGPVGRAYQKREKLILALPSQKLDSIILHGEISTKLVQKQVDELRRKLYVLIFASLGIALFLGWATGRRVVDPILSITAGLQNIRRGNLDTNVGLQRRDELGRLATSFEAMVEGLKARRRLATLVSDHALQTAVRMSETPDSIQGTRSLVTILVSDIRGFTTLCESRAPEEITVLLNAHFEAMARIIERHGGYVDKFIGDAIQAVFPSTGAEPSQEMTPFFECNLTGAPHRAVSAGLCMLDELDRINAHRKELAAFPYACGIGIATGDAVFTALGDPQSRLDVSVLGIPIKSAARLEALTKTHSPCPLAMDSLSRNLIGSSFGDVRILTRDDSLGEVFVFPSRPMAKTSGNVSVETLQTQTNTSQYFPQTSTPSKMQAQGGERKGHGEFGYRFLIFSAGLLLFILPAILIHQSFVAADASDLKNRLTEAHERNLGLFNRLSQQTLTTSPMESRFQRFIDATISRLDAIETFPAPRRIEEAARAELPGLASDGIRPILLLVATPSDSLNKDLSALRRIFDSRNTEYSLKSLACVASGPSASPGDGATSSNSCFHTLLQVLLQGYDYRHDLSLVPELSLSGMVGADLTTRILVREFRGHLCAITLASQSLWLYWQPLVSPRRVAELWGNSAPSSAQLPHMDFPTPTKLRSPVNTFLMGGILMLIPRVESEKSDFVGRLANLEDAGSGLAIAFPGTQRKPWLGKGFTTMLREAGLRRSFAGIPQPPSERGNWAMDTCIVVAGEKYRIMAASRLSPPDWTHDVRMKYFKPFFLFLLALGLSLWGMAIFAEAGLAARLSGQLWGGFMLSALLPVSCLFFVATLLSVEWQDTLSEQIRRHIRREMEAIEQRVQLHHPATWSLLAGNIRRPSLVAALEEEYVRHIDDLKNHSPQLTTSQALQARLNDLLISAHQSRLGIVISSLIITGPNGFFREAGRLQTASTSANPLSQSISFFDERVLERIKPESPQAPTGLMQRENTSGNELRRELIAQVLRRTFLSTFGVEATFRILYGLDEAVLINCGAYSPVIGQFATPSPSDPRFIAFWICNTAHSNLRAMERVLAPKNAGSPWHFPPLRGNSSGSPQKGVSSMALSSTTGGFPETHTPSGNILPIARAHPESSVQATQPMENELRIFAFEEQHHGMPVIAEDGESLPFLRRIAREVGGSWLPVRRRIEHNGETWIVEGSPGLNIPQFIYVGVAAEGPLLKNVRLRQGTLFFFIGLALFTIALLARSAAEGLVAPIPRLRKALDAVERGDFSFCLEMDRDDEFGQMMQAYNEMVRGLQEREQLGRMVSAAARRMGNSEADEIRARKGERRDVTILFIGIPDFEHLLEIVDPRDLQTRLNTQMARICSIIAEEGGDIDKVLGDKLLAVFDHQEIQTVGNNDNEPGKQAKRAAAGALHASGRLHKARQNGVLPFPVAIGINTGSVIAGLFGAGSRRDYTVIGDTVNLAARAESVAEGIPEPRIVAVETTVQLGGSAFKSIELPVTSVKGKKEAVRLFQLLNG
ncbi:MAG: adenylate/guanylate cyclase domain-containing protein [Candidatus Ozemobacteraceae bacterium]